MRKTLFWAMSLNASLCVALLGCDGSIDANGATDDAGSPLAQDMSPDVSVQDMPAALVDMKVPSMGDMARDMTPPVDLGAMDAGSTGSGGVDMSIVPDMAQDPVPVIVAQGRFGRTITSCDGGKSWAGNRDMVSDLHPRLCGVDQPGIRCGQDEMCTYQRRESAGCETQKCGCDHMPGSATGLIYGNGWFMATFGWGTDGVVWRSRDGVAWEDVSYAIEPTHAGGAFGNGTFVLGSAFAARSTDDGQTWTAREYADRVTFYDDAGEPNGRTRKAAFLDVDGGVFMMWGDGGATISRDDGVTWGPVEGWKSSCSDRARGAVAANGTVVMTYGGPMGMAASLCVSTDGARTFQTVELDHFVVRSNPVYAQGKFHMWTQYYQQGSHHYSSPDGLTWTHEPLEGVDSVSAVAYDPISETFASIVGAYETQRYIYSVDGTTWQDGSAQVPADVQHGIRDIIYGEAPASTLCP